MEKCLNCVHSKFEEQWGEYKCLIRHCRLYNTMSNKFVDCLFYNPIVTKPTNGEVNE